jgi:catechol 2,3-dioxygenase-like lactoylglutathione lyase family enzyme
MIDHLGIRVGNYERCKAFYEKALAPLGYALVSETQGWAGFGRDGKPSFWMHQDMAVTRSLHLAFAARSRAEVDAFHAAALAAGGEDNGRPGVRPHYHRHYYGAFVIDPDGRNVEAVCHAPCSE